MTIEPTIVRVTLETDPPGAEVRRSGKLLGITPYVLDVVPEQGSVRVELRLKGYKSVTKRIDATDDATIRETLVRERRGATPKTPDANPGNDLLSPDDI